VKLGHIFEPPVKKHAKMIESIEIDTGQAGPETAAIAAFGRTRRSPARVQDGVGHTQHLPAPIGRGSQSRDCC